MNPNIPKEYLVITRVKIYQAEGDEYGWRVGTDLYKPGTPEVLEHALNVLGAEGWSIVGFVNNNEPVLTRYKVDEEESGPTYLNSHANSASNTDG